MDDFDFWSHEWSTHGTCWLSVKTTPLDYFKQGLAWQNAKNITKILLDNGITFNTQYAKTNVLQILSFDMYGKNVELQCTNGKYVDAIMSCWDYEGVNPIDCPNDFNQCDTQIIFYDKI